MPKIKYKLIDPDEKFQKNPHTNAPSPQQNEMYVPMGCSQGFLYSCSGKYTQKNTPLSPPSDFKLMEAEKTSSQE
jgi:hypothetical protein